MAAPAAIGFGAQLFRDPRLSRGGTIACATCQQARRAFADGLQRARGLAPTDRNTLGLGNARLHADREQILRPLHLSAAEIDDVVAFLESLGERSAPPGMIAGGT